MSGETRCWEGLGCFRLIENRRTKKNGVANDIRWKLVRRADATAQTGGETSDSKGT